MSTRAGIGILRANGLVEHVYLHYDGYPSGAGKMLKEHYNTQELAEQIIAGGDISSLGARYPTAEEIAEARNFPEYDSYKFLSELGVTTTYKTWRGEDCPSRCSMLRDFYPRWNESSWEEFHYLWDGKQWLVATNVYDEGEVL